MKSDVKLALRYAYKLGEVSLEELQRLLLRSLRRKKGALGRGFRVVEGNIAPRLFTTILSAV